MLVETITSRKLEPMYMPGGIMPLQLDFKIPASKTIARGTICGELSATPGSVDAYAAYDLSTDTPSAAPVASEGGAGALAAGDYTIGYTEVTANGESLLSPVDTQTLGASKKLSLATVTLRAGVTSLNWYMSIAADSTALKFIVNNNGVGFDINSLPLPGALDPPIVSTSYRTATGIHIPRMIAVYDYATDASGNVFIATTAVSSFGESYKQVPFFMAGVFRTEDLTGIVANLFTHPGWRLVHGNNTNGLIELG
jgi:hypothetical protein